MSTDPAKLDDIVFKGCDADEDHVENLLNTYNDEYEKYRSDRAQIINNEVNALFNAPGFTNSVTSINSDPQLLPLLVQAFNENISSGANLGDLDHDLKHISSALDNKFPRAVQKSETKVQNNTFWNSAGLLLGGGGLLVSAGGFLYTIVHNETNNLPNPDLDALADDLQQKALDVAKQWIGLQPADIWPQVAVFTENQQPNITAQLLILSFIKQLSPAPVQNGVTWTYADGDFKKQVASLQQTYDQTSGDASAQAAAMYRSIPSLQYDGYAQGQVVTVPTSVGAELASYVLMSAQLGKK